EALVPTSPGRRRGFGVLLLRADESFFATVAPGQGKAGPSSTPPASHRKPEGLEPAFAEAHRGLLRAGLSGPRSHGPAGAVGQRRVAAQVWRSAVHTSSAPPGRLATEMSLKARAWARVSAPSMASPRIRATRSSWGERGRALLGRAKKT